MKKTLITLSTFLLTSLFVTTGHAQVSDTETTNATVNFTEGSLMLDSAPSALSFSAVVQAAEQTVPSTEQDLVIQTTDNRGMSSELMWRLTGQLSEFINAAEATTLANAVITFNEGSSSTTLIDITSPTLLGDSLTSGGAAEDFALAQRTPEDSTVGIGTWSMNYSDADLTILQNTAESGTHTASITWTLTDAPE